MTGPVSRALALRFLGGFAAWLGPVPVAGFPYDKVRALLAYLALEGGEHRREHLAELLWPGVDAQRARANLRVCLFDLRRLLGDAGGPAGAPALIEAGHHTLRLRGAGAGVRLDVADFLALAGTTPESPDLLTQAVAHYQGPLLAGLSLPDAPEFDAWLAGRRGQLQREAVRVLERLVAHHEALGQDAQALQYAQRATEVDPWCEPLQRTCLRLLARHSPAAALAHYETFRRALADELGVAPEPQTLALAAELAGPGAAPPATVPAAGTGRPERRRLAVLACDFEPRADMDPEEAAAGLGGLVARGAQLVRAHGGHVVVAQGGELLAVFGYPHAREHAPRDAAQAALALAQAWRADPAAQGGGAVHDDPRAGGPDFTLRAGLHAGWVFAEAGGGPPDAAGVLTKAARRLAHASPAGGTTASAALRRLLGGPWFQWAPPAADGSALLLARGPGAAPRGEADTPLPPLVGRRAELAQLVAAWDGACTGQRLGALLQAEAGRGKSRLAAALAEHVRQHGGAVLELACQAGAAHIPYLPFVDSLQRQLGLEDAAGAQDTGTATARAAQALQHLGLDAEAALPVLLPLLGLAPAGPAQGDGSDGGDGSAPPAAPALYPGERKEREQALLARLFGRAPDGRPLLLIVEDLHWADPATLEVLERLLAGPQRCPLLLLCTARAAQHGPLAARLAVVVELPPLSGQAIRALVAQLAGPAPAALSDALLASIVVRADGVPLYAEELARAALAGGGGGGVGAGAGAGDVPETLWDALAARLDGLGPAKRIAQYAACIGRDFGEDLLRAIATAQDDVGGGLRVLQQAGLVGRRLDGPLSFRHALIRQAAYESLAQAERRQIHARLAQALGTGFAERVRAHPEILAHHLSESTHPGAAHAWWLAGTQAASRSALAEAIHDFQAGLAAVQAVPEGDPARAPAELQLQIGLGTALVGAQGYGSEAARDAFHRAWALSASAPAGLDLFPLMWGLWMVGRHGEDEPPLEYAERLARMAEGSTDPARRMAVEYAFGNNTLWLGEFARARIHLQTAIAWRARVGDAETLARFGEDIGIAARALLAWVHWIEGDFDRARAAADENVAQARALGHAHSFGYAMSCAAVLYRHLREPARVAALSGELLAYAQHHRLLLWQASAAALLGWAQAVQGADAGLAPIREGLVGVRLVFRVIEITFMAFLIDALAHLRRPAEALPVIDEALERAAANHDTHFVPELLRQRGDALARLFPADTTTPLALYRQALALAEQRGAATFALRSATRIARLRAGQGAHAEAAALLERALGRVTGPATSPDLREAHACLAACRAASGAECS